MATSLELTFDQANWPDTVHDPSTAVPCHQDTRRTQIHTSHPGSKLKPTFMQAIDCKRLQPNWNQHLCKLSTVSDCKQAETNIYVRYLLQVTANKLKSAFMQAVIYKYDQIINKYIPDRNRQAFYGHYLVKQGLAICKQWAYAFNLSWSSAMKSFFLYGHISTILLWYIGLHVSHQKQFASLPFGAL